MANTDSILDSTKKSLGLDPGYDVFDSDVLMHLNTVFFTLNQLGVGPVGVFRVDDKETTWEAFFGTDTDLEAVKTYAFLKVRLLFDPPSTSFAIDSMKKQAEEIEWRLMVQKDPTPKLSAPYFRS